MSVGDPEAVVAVTGGTLIDGTGGRPLTDAVVVIEGERFTRVGPAAATPVPAGARVIDARGKWLIPGLCDAHVHVYTPDRWHPEFFLAAGVTTVLDLGGQVEPVTAHRAAIASGARAGPRTFFTGPLLEEGAVYPGFASFSRHVEAARIEAEVDALLDAGTDAIKLYISVRPDTARRASARAHARGRPVFLHQQAIWGEEAPAAGVDCCEHLNVLGGLAPEAMRPADAGSLTPFEYGGFLWRFLPDLDPGSDRVRRLWDAMLTAGTALDPTLVLYAARPAALGDDVGDSSLDHPEHTPLLPRLPRPVADELVSRWAERRRAAAGASEGSKARTRRAWQSMLMLVGGFHRAGGVVLAGTDCPNVAIVSGFSLHRELELLVRAGLPPMEALLAATRRPAERLGKADVFGTVAPGRAADLLVLGANPLTDIRHTRRLERVIARGRSYDPARLPGSSSGARQD